MARTSSTCLKRHRAAAPDADPYSHGTKVPDHHPAHTSGLATLERVHSPCHCTHCLQHVSLFCSLSNSLLKSLPASCPPVSSLLLHPRISLKAPQVQDLDATKLTASCFWWFSPSQLQLPKTPLLQVHRTPMPLLSRKTGVEKVFLPKAH